MLVPQAQSVSLAPVVIQVPKVTKEVEGIRGYKDQGALLVLVDHRDPQVSLVLCHSEGRLLVLLFSSLLIPMLR